MLRVVALAFVSCGLLACGNSGDGGDAGTSAGLGTCGLRASATGAVSATFTGQDDAACLTQHSFDEGLDVDFLHSSANVSLSLSIASVTEGETGEDYPTEVSVRSDDSGRFQGSECATTITEHRLVETEASTLGELRHYQVSGHGACTSALVSTSDASADTTVAELAFRAQFTWRD